MTSIVLAADGLLGDRLEEILATDHMVERLTEGADLLKVAQCRDDAVFITVLVQPLGDFLELLTAFRCRRPEGEIVVVSDGLVPAQVSLAVFRHGATDVVEQPVDQPERLLQAISKGILRQRQATESAQLVQQLVDRNYLLSRIHELLDELHRAPSLDALLSGVMPALREISGATAVAITVDGPEAVTAGWPLPHDAPADRTIPLHLEEQAVGTVHLQGAQMFAGYAISSEDLFIALTRQLALAIHHHQRLCLAQDEAVRDGLTRLYNHAFFRRSLKLAYDLWQRYQRPFAVIMLDLDSFKGTNDRFGHLTGDAVLAAVGRQIADTTRTVDVPARYGGDEFAVILTDTAYTGAITLAGRLGRAIGALGLPGVDPVGVSIGVTVVGPSDRHGIDVLQRADMALLQAKAQGKNRICGKPIGDMSPPGHQAGSREQPTQVWPECPAALDQAEPAKTVSPPSLAASWLP